MVKTYSRQGVRVENPDQNQKTLVLIGRSGNGKSALGNCILGRNAFPSEASPCGVTLNCALEEGLLPDGGMLRIIDTPGTKLDIHISVLFLLMSCLAAYYDDACFLPIVRALN
ncbi:unnamed protein product [Linum tenue]|uniref:AIG1-type G domain-containing protein n=1 Tax=Linum tenue TaxID=586396 RepID=A0AAV0RZ57_9ROSI|nr:unnamed protein product [Linum tenue]